MTTIEQAAERERELRDRITRLESSNGALRVDGDRRAALAHERAEGAWKVATDALAALRKAGIEPDAELATLVADANRWNTFMARAVAEERERLEEFRLRMVRLIEGLKRCSGHRRGVTPEECGKLARAIGRANNKALGR